MVMEVSSVGSAPTVDVGLVHTKVDLQHINGTRSAEVGGNIRRSVVAFSISSLKYMRKICLANANVFFVFLQSL